MNKSKKYYGILPVVALLLISLAVFRQVVLHPNYLMTSGKGDLADLYAPRKRFQVEDARATGELTLWDPYSDCGAPVAGNIQNATFYPFYIFFYILPSDGAFGFIILLNLFLGGLFAYLFIRSLGLSAGASFLGAAAYMLSGAWACRLFPGHIMIYNNFPWIPLGLLGAKRLFETARERWSKAVFWALIMSLALALQLLGGHTQYFVYSTLILAVFCVYEAIRGSAGARSIRPAAGLVLAALAAAFALALAMIQFLPAYEFSEYVLGEEGRDIAYAASGGSFSPDRWITVSLPDYFGSPANETYWGAETYWELGAYAGILPVVLAFAAVLLVRRGYVWFFFGLSLFIFLYSLGKYSPVFQLLQHIPYMSVFRFPGRILAMLALPVGVLAAYGAEHLLAVAGKPLGSARLWIAVVLTVLVIASLAALPLVGPYEKQLERRWSGPLAERLPPDAPLSGAQGANLLRSRMDTLHDMLEWGFIRLAIILAAGAALFWTASFTGGKKWLVWVAGAIIVIDLGTHAAGFVQTNRVEKIYPPGYFLFSALPDNQDGSSYRIAQYHVPIDYKQFRRRRYNLTGGDIDSSELEYVKKYLNKADIRTNDLHGALNMKYHIDYASRESDGFPSRQVGNVYVVENTGDLGRAFVVRNIVPIPSSRPEKALETLLSGKIMRETATVEGEIDFPLNNPGRFKQAEIIEYHANQIKVKVNLEHPGLLVLSEIWYPDWKAKDIHNGVAKLKKVYKTNYALRGVFLEKGEHIVEFRYDPQSYKTGKLVTFVSVGFLAIGLLATGILSRRPTRERRK
ncbi:MAG: hypothetical protein ABIH04_03710 [Planctomycetota bacterium]